MQAFITNTCDVYIASISYIAFMVDFLEVPATYSPHILVYMDSLYILTYLLAFAYLRHLHIYL